MPESVVSLSPAGAARLQDLIWPSRLTAAGTALLDTSQTGRTRTENLTGTIAGIGGGGPNPSPDVRLGVPCARFSCTGVDGVSFRFHPAMGFMVNTPNSGIVTSAAVGDVVTRIIWSFCGSGIAPNAGSDMGLEIVRPGGAGTGRILVDAAEGWGFRLADANTLQFLVRGPNGLITLNLTANPFDLTTWHVIDMRITSGTVVSAATLDVRLDGTPLALGALNSSWAAGTNLPAAAAVAGTVGWMPCLVCNPNPINQYWVYQLRFIQAPNVLATI